MKLMIVESPNKIKKIKAILGSGWDVAASVGHIRDLPVKSLGIEPNTYRLEYQILERSESVVAQLRQRAARSEQVYLATDPDREGEAIAWHLQQVLNLRRYARVTFDAITEKVVRGAIEAPRQLDNNLVHAQEARRGADRLVGYQVNGCDHGWFAPGRSARRDGRLIAGSGGSGWEPRYGDCSGQNLG
jgi:DNA topoisomerase I